MKTPEQIFEEIRAQATNGSCKTCKWCVPCEPPEGLPDVTHECAVQDTSRPIYFTQESLESKPYLWRSDVGEHYDWANKKFIEECLAYQQSNGGEVTCWDAFPHRDFMETLGHALVLERAIKENKLDELIRWLNDG